MKAYRAHGSTLQPGQAVPPSKFFFNALDPNRKAVEEMLESIRPERLPQRNGAIFVFEDQSEARKWASSNRRYLYGVEFETTAILLKADWCWLSLIEQHLKRNDLQNAQADANNYWAGKPTNSPVWELLVSSAIVAEEIVIEERTRLRCEAGGLQDPRDWVPNASADVFADSRNSKEAATRSI